MRNMHLNLHYAAQGLAFSLMAFPFFLPLGVLSAQIVNATIPPTPGQFTMISEDGGPGERSFSQYNRKVACAMLCSNISRSEEALNVSCSFSPTLPARKPLMFLSSFDSSKLAGAAIRNNLWCCRCDARVMRSALLRWKKGPQYNDSSLKRGPAVCVDLPGLPSLRLLCSISPPSRPTDSPAQPRVLHCNGPSVCRPPPLRTRYDVEAWVRHYVENYKVVVFAKSTCPFCSLALDALKSFAPDVCTIMIDHSPLMPDFQDVLEHTTGARTVPRIFIGGRFIGGCDDVLKLVDANLLQGLLKDAGAI